MIGLVKGNGDIKAETINKQARECYELLGIQLPTFQKKSDMRNKILALGPYSKSSVERAKEEEVERKKAQEAKNKRKIASEKGQRSETTTDSSKERVTKEESSTQSGTVKRKRGRPIGAKDKHPRKRRERVDLESNI